MNTPAVRLVMAAVAAALLMPSGARALEPHERTGFFIGVGLGGGYANWDWGEDIDDDPSEGSGVGNFRIGGALRENLLLGLEVSSWVKDYEVELAGDDVGDATLTFSAATFAATWFPGNMGWYLRGGMGFAAAEGEVTFDTGGSATISIKERDNGFAMVGASGYEWRLTQKFAMGPQVELFYLLVDGDIVDNALVVDAALQFNWYW